MPCSISSQTSESPLSRRTTVRRTRASSAALSHETEFTLVYTALLPFFPSPPFLERDTRPLATMAAVNSQMMPSQASTNYKEAFSLFDKRGNGRVTIDSLGDLLRACGQNPTLSEIEDLKLQAGGADCTCPSPNTLPIPTPLQRHTQTNKETAQSTSQPSPRSSTGPTGSATQATRQRTRAASRSSTRSSRASSAWGSCGISSRTWGRR